jgi:multimeric flavodoxin WrbA
VRAKNALLLVASPRGFKSTSASLGTYLLEKLEQGGFETHKIHVQSAMHTAQGQSELLAKAAASNLIILAFPLYIDSLPAQLILALEKVAQQRRSTASPKPQRLVAIVNNGFPEASQNATAVAICRQFANEAGIDWAGGLSLGGGGAINGANLKDAGYIARHVVESLDLAVADLLVQRPVSDEAVALMAKNVIPRWLFLFFANRGWKGMAKKYDAEKNLLDRT